MPTRGRKPPLLPPELDGPDEPDSQLLAKAHVDAIKAGTADGLAAVAGGGKTEAEIAVAFVESLRARHVPDHWIGCMFGDGYALGEMTATFFTAGMGYLDKGPK